MENDINQVTAFMYYMYNKWCIGEAKKVFGNMLGEHIFYKWANYRDKGSELYWYSTLDRCNRNKVVRRAIELYGNESNW